MPQGKMKVKAKVPKSIEAKRKAKKGPAISKRGSAPVAAKKAKKVEAQKLKKIITKSVNAAAEEEIRAIAMDGKKSLLSKKGNSTGKATPKKIERMLDLQRQNKETQSPTSKGKLKKKRNVSKNCREKALLNKTR